MSRYISTSIRDVHKLLAEQKISMRDLYNESIKIIEETKHLNAFITVSTNPKIRDEKKGCKGLLDGVPISIKDNFCTDQQLTSCGSKMLHNFFPPYNATAVSRLLEANCLIIGKTNMDEFAMGSSSITSFYGPTKYRSNNKPQNEDWYMAGGSSTGSAVSVATGACFASLGTDTGGSTRQPASLTGVVGFKPTYGLISRFGLIPLAHCLDVVSILARNVDDVLLIFDTIVGRDDNDLTSIDHSEVLKRSFPDPSKSMIRIGIPEEFIIKSGMSNDVSELYDEALKLIKKSSNFSLSIVKLPQSSLATECYTIISSAEIASNMSCYDGVRYGFSVDNEKSKSLNRDQFYMANRDEGFGPEVKKRILLGNYFLLSGNREKYLVQALKLRRLINDEFEKAFSDVDIILMPSTPTTSIPYSEWLEKQENNSLFYDDYFLIPSNLANVPSISIPSGMSKRGLPVGLQLVARKFGDLDLLSISRLLEKLLDEIK